MEFVRSRMPRPDGRLPCVPCEVSARGATAFSGRPTPQRRARRVHGLSLRSSQPRPSRGTRPALLHSAKASASARASAVDCHQGKRVSPRGPLLSGSAITRGCGAQRSAARRWKNRSGCFHRGLQRRCRRDVSTAIGPWSDSSRRLGEAHPPITLQNTRQEQGGMRSGKVGARSK